MWVITLTTTDHKGFSRDYKAIIPAPADIDHLQLIEIARQHYNLKQTAITEFVLSWNVPVLALKGK